MKLGIISDIHEDKNSLFSALRLLEKEGVNEIACLGDIVGFCHPQKPFVQMPDAKTCIQVIQKNCKYIVAGNHDLNAAQIFPKNNPGFTYPDNWFSLSPNERKRVALEKVWPYDDEIPGNLNEEEKQWITTLPELLSIDILSVKIFLSHYIYPDLTGSSTRFISSVKDVSDHFTFCESKNIDYFLFGHSHLHGLLKISQNAMIRQDFDNENIWRKSELSLIVDDTFMGYSAPAIVNGIMPGAVIVWDFNQMKIKYLPL